MFTFHRGHASSLLVLTLGTLLFSSGCARQQEATVVAPVITATAPSDSGTVYVPAVRSSFERENLSGNKNSGFQAINDPTYPKFPAVIDETTTYIELSSMALQAALAEEARDEIELKEVVVRQQAIIAFWLSQHSTLKSFVASAKAERQAIQAYEVNEIRHRSNWERKQDAMQIAWDAELRREKMRVLPLVPPDLQQRLLLQLRSADPQRSRWCNVVP